MMIIENTEVWTVKKNVKRKSVQFITEHCSQHRGSKHCKEIKKIDWTNMYNIHYMYVYMLYSVQDLYYTYTVTVHEHEFMFKMMHYNVL